MSLFPAAGRLFIVSAPSGVGKSTIINRVLKAFPNIRFSVSCTTRSIRTGEVAGRDYHFLSKEEFTHGIKSGRFLEWAEVHGNLYGTDGQIISDWLQAGYGVLLEIDVQGARMIRCAYPFAQTIFILPPSMNELEARLRKRASETDEQLSIRISAAKREIIESVWFDHIIVNEDLDEAVEDFRAILRASRSRREFQAPALKKFLESI